MIYRYRTNNNYYRRYLVLFRLITFIGRMLHTEIKPEGASLGQRDSIGRPARWRIGEYLLDMSVTGEIKYPGRIKISLAQGSNNDITGLGL